MAHWAEIDENGIVLRVTVGSNDDPDEGYQWLIDNLGGTWIKTSYNTYKGVHSLGGTPLRGNYAGPGFHYIKDLDIFLPPKPFANEDPDKIFNSWVPYPEKFIWKPPIPKPDSGLWKWDEDTGGWVEGEQTVVQ